MIIIDEINTFELLIIIPVNDNWNCKRIVKLIKDEN